MERYDKGRDLLLPQREFWLDLSMRYPAAKVNLDYSIPTELSLSIVCSNEKDRALAKRHYDQALELLKCGADCCK